MKKNLTLNFTTKMGVRMCAEQTYPFCIQPTFWYYPPQVIKNYCSVRQGCSKLYQIHIFTKNPDQIRRIFLKTRKIECSQCKQRKTWRKLWNRNLTTSRQGGGVCRRVHLITTFLCRSLCRAQSSFYYW